MASLQIKAHAGQQTPVFGMPTAAVANVSMAATQVQPAAQRQDKFKSF